MTMRILKIEQANEDQSTLITKYVYMNREIAYCQISYFDFIRMLGTRF